MKSEVGTGGNGGGFMKGWVRRFGRVYKRWRMKLGTDGGFMKGEVKNKGTGEGFVKGWVRNWD